MFRTRLCCVLVPAFCLSLIPVASAAESVTEALDRLEKKNASVNSVYMQSRTVIEEDKNKRQSTLKVWRKKAGDKWKYRMVTTSEGDGKDKDKARGSVTASDGQSEWREVAMGDQTMVFKSKAANSGNQDFADVRARVKAGEAKIKGKEKVEGQDCTVIEINGNDNGNRSEITYWISDEHGLVLRSRITRSDRNKSETVVTEIKVNEPISDNDLNYTPPSGVAVIDTDNMPSPEKKPANKP